MSKEEIEFFGAWVQFFIRNLRGTTIYDSQLDVPPSTGTNNDGYNAMGDAVALPVASFIDKSFLTKLAEVIGKYNAIIDAKETDPSQRIEFEAK